MRPLYTYVSLALAYLITAALPASAQTGLDVQAEPQRLEYLAPISAQSQDFCITMMADFPNDNHIPRYQFFRLTEELAQDATYDFKRALAAYNDADIPANTPILEIIEAIANPILRQAAPEIVTTYMGQLIEFSQTCNTFISGQIKSLKAFDPTLADSDGVIREDALYLRQILLDSLSRLGAIEDPAFSYAVADYERGLVRTRDDIEYTSFVFEIDDIEALYMEDLDGRLARSNDLINKEINRETLGDAVALSEDMNEDLKRKGDQDTVYTLLQILGF